MKNIYFIFIFKRILVLMIIKDYWLHTENIDDEWTKLVTNFYTNGYKHSN